MVDQCPSSERENLRMLTFQISMPPDMVNEIESIAREESYATKKAVSRAAKIRDLCRESLNRLQHEQT
ncbi:ribbon-helix-helix domain-containing protein [bacterium]|nr:ribbon-helix-helix domain-containing protein [bacterium]